MTAAALAGRLASSTVQKAPDPDTVSPGFAGFVTIFLLTVATILLIRSMTRHLRKVRYSVDPAAEPEHADRPAGPGASAGPNRSAAPDDRVGPNAATCPDEPRPPTASGR
jgi:hypothetical protein